MQLYILLSSRVKIYSITVNNTIDGGADHCRSCPVSSGSGYVVPFRSEISKVVPSVCNTAHTSVKYSTLACGVCRNSHTQNPKFGIWPILSLQNVLIAIRFLWQTKEGCFWSSMGRFLLVNNIQSCNALHCYDWCIMLCLCSLSFFLRCISCPKGNYVDTEKHKCVPCPIGIFFFVHGKEWPFSCALSNHLGFCFCSGKGAWTFYSDALFFVNRHLFEHQWPIWI